MGPADCLVGVGSVVRVRVRVRVTEPPALFCISQENFFFSASARPRTTYIKIQTHTHLVGELERCPVLECHGIVRLVEHSDDSIAVVENPIPFGWVRTITQGTRRRGDGRHLGTGAGRRGGGLRREAEQQSLLVDQDGVRGLPLLVSLTQSKQFPPRQLLKDERRQAHLWLTKMLKPVSRSLLPTGP